MIKDGTILQIPVLANFVSLRIDALILGQYKPSSSVGYYSIATAICEALLLGSLVVQTAFYSTVSQIIHDKTQMAMKTLRIYRNNLMLFLIGGIILAITAPWLILLLYGKAFLPSLKPLFILLPGSIMLYSHTILGNYMVSSRRFLPFAAICVTGAALNVFLNLYLIPRFDYNGAALTSTITYSITAILLIVGFLTTSKMYFREFVKQLRITQEDLMVYKNIFKSIFAKQKEKLSA